MFLSWNWSWKNKWNSNKDFVIWTVWDFSNNQSFIEWFKKFSWTNKQINFESFSSYEDYSLALTYAISSGNAPDIFVLNNNEKNSLFENQTIWISPKIVDVDFFRKNYKTFITDQIISKTENWEFLLWLPVWYETLWIFYNKNFVNPSDLNNFSSLNSAISRLKEQNSDYTPISIWNWSTVDFSEDIITQFILSESQDKSISSISRKSIQSWLANYMFFWDENWDNWYNKRFKEMKLAKQTWVDLFSIWDTFMLVWYPRLINKIDEKWFSSSLLFATSFPNDSITKANLINYNYFVINKDTKNSELANKFISYLTTKEWIENYFDNFSYYLPTMINFEENILSKKIHPNYNIKISDFYNSSYNYTSFDKWVKVIYDSEIKKIIDGENMSVENFVNFQKSLVCKTNKIINQTDFSKSCE